MVSRHEFLARLHHLLMPRYYLEIGVQYGESLKLASCDTVGIDPEPRVVSMPINAVIYNMTSDLFFATQAERLKAPIDLAFIDGMHLWEYALRDFVNVERHSHPRGVIVLDDVLPYSPDIATREQPPGDWTGDVWKVYEYLAMNRPDLSMHLVDTMPTGTLVVWDLDPAFDWSVCPAETEFSDDTPPPDYILLRSRAQRPDTVINLLKERL